LAKRIGKSEWLHEQVPVVLGELIHRAGESRDRDGGARGIGAHAAAGDVGGDGGGQEWASAVVPRYQRRIREVNGAVGRHLPSVLSQRFADKTGRRSRGFRRPFSSTRTAWGSRWSGPGTA
jgi:hypothetical protein